MNSGKNRYLNKLGQLVEMSVKMGTMVDYVQAGGGNTSVKFEDGYMAIKASGYLLKEMTAHSGFVAVDAKAMKAYHEKEHRETEDCNKEAMTQAMASIRQINGEKKARPSVEVGFHSLLDTFVLHLHPVYVNVLMCAEHGTERAVQIAEKAGLAATAVPYSMPGYGLTKLVLRAKEVYEEKTGKMPEVVFLKNHGVITTAATGEEAVRLMDQVNSAIGETLLLPVMPQTGIEPWQDGYRSTCAWLSEALGEEPDLIRAIRFEPVYPDQLVYTANELDSEETGSGKIFVSNGHFCYRAGEKEAKALDETMVALTYIYYYIKKLGFSYERLTPEECAEVLGWDSEKYRKSIMAEV
ncbi:class II aldolase/adducin family protein [Lachnospiraceae bacterium LCP19S3_B12]